MVSISIYNENEVIYLKTSNEINDIKIKNLINNYFIKKDKNLYKLKSNFNVKEIRYLVSLINKYCNKDFELINQIDFLKINETLNDLITNKNLLKENILNKNEWYFGNEWIEFNDFLDNIFVRKLRTQQKWDAFFMYKTIRCCNFSVPGSGKTATCLGTYSYLRYKKEINKIVVIGPKNSFYSWKNEIKSCFGSDVKFNIFDISQNSINSDLDIALIGKNVILLNYEILPKYSDVLNELLIDSKSLVIFDEIHRIKNDIGKRAAASINTIMNAKYVICLTGTPIPNTYKDIYNILNIMCPNNYGSVFGYTPEQLQNLEDVESLNKKFYLYFCRTNKNQLGVPVPNEDLIITTNFDNDLKLLTSKYLKQKRKNYLESIIRLLQIESFPKMLMFDQNINDFGFSDNDELILNKISNQEILDLIDCCNNLTPKVKSCIELVDKLIRENKKIIIWCLFTYSINELFKIFVSKCYRVAIIDGSVDQKDREKILDNYRSGNYDILITNPQTLAESVSLHDVCHDAIYFEYSYNLVHLLQSKDRIHRLGLKDNQYTQYYFLNSGFDTNNGYYNLGQKIYDRLVEKEKVMLEAIDSQKLEKYSSDEHEIKEILSDLDILKG